MSCSTRAIRSTPRSSGGPTPSSTRVSAITPCSSWRRRKRSRSRSRWRQRASSTTSGRPERSRGGRRIRGGDRQAHRPRPWASVGGTPVHQCPTCGKQLDESIRFCPDDGTPLTDTAASARTPTGGKRPASRQLPLPTVVGQRYKLTEFRGGGGMATVYRATDMTLEREVAVKLINPDLRSE